MTQRPEEADKSLGNGVTNSCEPPNPSPMEEQSMLLQTEPSLQPLVGLIFVHALSIHLSYLS